MNNSYHSGLHRFAVFTSLWTVLLFVAGALVTSKDAALSVPDWPKSFGTWLPSWAMLRGGAFFEHSHRVIAGGLGVLILILAIWLWIAEKRASLRWLGAAALGGVVVQAILGGEVVRQLLHYWLPVLHACFAQIIFGAVFSVAVLTSRWWLAERPSLEDRGAPSVHAVAWINAAVIFLQVLLGAGFRHGEIPIWPHLVGAFAVLGTIVWTALALGKRFEDSPELSFGRVLLHAVFGLQFLLGIAAWWSRVSTADAPQPMPVMVSLTVIHTVFGALVFVSSILVVLMCYRLVPRRRGVAVASQREAAVR